MATALALVEPKAPIVTDEQVALIKKTVAKDATQDELKLYFYDCARQGVHPLDRLIHFTKRAGKYTPITSIDFMRMRAADTGEYAGSDDPVFADDGGSIKSATVTVWRLVQGTRCPFTATARWSEYKPDEAFMWKKMPHTMLGKCAEALALRKGFPRQLAGLYAKEEMEQAGGSNFVESVYDKQPTYPPEPVQIRDAGAAPVGDSASDDDLTITRVDLTPTKNKSVTRYLIVLSDGRQMTTINRALGTRCKEYADAGAAVEVRCSESKFGLQLEEVSSPSDPKSTSTVDLTASDIPF